MSDEKKPFAWYEAETDTVRLSGSDVSRIDWREAIASINAAVERERREAAVKALDSLCALLDESKISRDRELSVLIRSRADKIERGEQ